MIDYDNQAGEEVWVVLFIDDKKVEEHLLEKDAYYGIGEDDYYLKPGMHGFHVLIYDQDRNFKFNQSIHFSIEYDFSIKITIEDEDVQISIIEYKPKPENNHAPIMMEGRFTKINNTTYRFSVIYIDVDNDTPVNANLFVDEYYYDNDGSLRSNLTVYDLEHINGSFITGALYQKEIGGYDRIDYFAFAFDDGYEIAIPLDDTPYTDT